MTEQLHYCPNSLCKNQHLWPSVLDETLLCPKCNVVYKMVDGVVQVNLEWKIGKADESNE